MSDREEKDFHRRSFMSSACCAAALAALAPRAFAGQNDPEGEARVKEHVASLDSGLDPLPPTRLYPDMPRAVVAARGVTSSIEDAVREAVIAAGGLDEIERGQTVMIKPNMTGPAIKDKYPGRITTDPEVVRAVIRICRERGASKIYVGDRGMFWPNTAIHTTGIAKVCKEEGAITYPWNKSPYVLFRPGKRHWSQGFHIPEILTQVDHFINVPLLKNHGALNPGADYTCCLKSFVGVCMPKDRHQGGADELHARNIGEKIAELNLSLKPTINIVDAVEIMVSGGPDGLSKKRSVWARPNIILAGKDRVACDSLAVAILKRYGAEAKVGNDYINKSVWDQVQIYYAAELGIGQADPANITIEDINVPLMDEIRDNWA
ncbi:MAG TPA: DUF362 domain-containing protein [bacterium]|nr:DUF362 domain-containing protein [bacterium]